MAQVGEFFYRSSNLSMLLLATSIPLPAAAQVGEFLGSTGIVTAYNCHQIDCPFIGPKYAATFNMVGDFQSTSSWTQPTFPDLYYPPTPVAPGPADTIGISGVFSGYLTPKLGPPYTVGGYDVYGNYTLGYGGNAGYTGGDGFVVTNVGGTVSSLSLSGPGTATLTGLTATDHVLLQASTAYVDIQFDGNGDLTYISEYRERNLTVNGGSLTTPLLILQNLRDAHNMGFGGPFQGDPAATTSHLVIDGASLSGDVTRVDPTAISLYGYSSPYDQGSAILPVELRNGAKLTAKTELDLVTVDPVDQPHVTGTTRLAVDHSDVHAGLIVIGTGPTGLGSGFFGSAELNLTHHATLTSDTSLIIGDTGNGHLTVTDSTVQARETIIGNQRYSFAEITGTSTWTNDGYLTVGQHDSGYLSIRDGAKVYNNGTYGNGFIAGLDGSGGSSATVTGNGSLWQMDGYLIIGGGGQATLYVTDKGKVETDDFVGVLGSQGEGRIEITGGGELTADSKGGSGTSSIVFGLNPGDHTTLLVSGADSKLTSKQSMVVGYGGQGIANVENGGEIVVEGLQMRVGRNAGSYGELNIIGTDSRVSIDNGGLYIGYGGNGWVTVSAGGELSAHSTDIGGLVTGNGLLQIDGTGTHADLGDLVVGNQGQGQLDITAVVAAESVTLGQAAGSTGTITIDSAGSSLTASELTVGGKGTGLLVATDGAEIHISGLATLGEQAGGVGTMILGYGGNAAVSFNSGGLTVGGSGTGELSAGGSNIIVNGNLTVAEEAGSQGTVTIGGSGGANTTASLTVTGTVTVGDAGVGSLAVLAGSSLEVDGGKISLGEKTSGNGVLALNGGNLAVGGEIVVGGAGTGQLFVQMGASNSVGLGGAPKLTVGEQAGSSGLVVIDGSGSALQVASATIGEAGVGQLKLTQGSLLTTIGNLEIASKGTASGSSVVVDSGSMLAINGGLTVGSNGTANLVVDNGGKVVAVGDVTLAEYSTSTAHILVTGGSGGDASSLGYGGAMEIGGHGVARLDVEKGGFVAPTPGGLGEVSIAAEAGSSGTLTVTGKNADTGVASMFLANILTVGGGEHEAGGTGRLQTGPDGIVKISHILNSWDDGVIDLSAGGTIIVGDVPDLGVVGSAGVLQLLTGGVLEGTGTIIGNVNNDGGTVSPGHSPGTLKIKGNYTQIGGIIDLQIGGTGLGQFDQLIIDGAFDLIGGTILFDFINGFAPRINDVFNLINASTWLNFDRVHFSYTGLEDGFGYSPSFDTLTGRFNLIAQTDGITRVPEPASMLLLVAGLIALAYSRRRAVSVGTPKRRVTAASVRAGIPHTRGFRPFVRTWQAQAI